LGNEKTVGQFSVFEEFFTAHGFRRGDDRRAAAEKEEEREARFFLQMHT
jgi:hypothetical protein